MSPKHHLDHGDRCFGEEILRYRFRRGMTSRTVSTVGDREFMFDVSLESITITSGNIGEFAFYGCTSLRTVTFGASVTGIGAYAFYGCTKLLNITIPESVLFIGDCAFANASATLVLPYVAYNVSPALRVSRYAIYSDIDVYATIILVGATIKYLIDQHTGPLIASDVSSSGSFLSIDPITKVCNGFNASGLYPKPPILVFPVGVKSISPKAFANNSATMFVSFPRSLEEIGEFAFFRCVSIHTCESAADSLVIRAYAFSECASLVGMFFKTISHIYDAAFWGTSSDTLNVDNVGTRISPYAFSWWYPHFIYFSTTQTTISATDIVFGGYEFTENLPVSMAFLDIDPQTKVCRGFRSDESLRPRTIIFREEITSIAPDAFANNTEIIEAFFVTPALGSIGARAFANCSALTEVSFKYQYNGKPMVISENAFRATAISSAVFNNLVSLVKTGAFADCLLLEDVSYSGATLFEKGVFENTPYIQNLVLEPDSYYYHPMIDEPFVNLIAVYPFLNGLNVPGIMMNVYINDTFIGVTTANRFEDESNMTVAPILIDISCGPTYTISTCISIDGMREIGSRVSVEYNGSYNLPFFDLPVWWQDYLTDRSLIERTIAERYAPILLSTEYPLTYYLSDRGNISGGLKEYAIKWHFRWLTEPGYNQHFTYLFYIYGLMFSSSDPELQDLGRLMVTKCISEAHDLDSNAAPILKSMGSTTGVFLFWDKIRFDVAWSLFKEYRIYDSGMLIKSNITTDNCLLTDVSPGTHTYELETISFLDKRERMRSSVTVTVQDKIDWVLDVTTSPDRSLTASAAPKPVRLSRPFFIDRSHGLQARPRMFGGLGVELTPSTPIDVDAVATGDRIITVTWTLPEVLDLPPTGYRLTVHDVTAGSSRELDTDSTNLTIDVSGLVAWNYYRFTVRSLFTNGMSSWSESSPIVQALSVPNPPESPVLDVSADGGLLWLDWIPPPSTPDTPILSYRIELVDVSNGGSVRTISGVTTRPYTIANGGSRYKFRARAINRFGEGGWSIYSAIMDPEGIPDAPFLSGEIVPVRGQDISLNWTTPANVGPPIASYIITTDEGSTELLSLQTRHMILAQPYGYPVDVSVRAKNSRGRLGAISNQITLTPLTVPDPPVLTLVELTDQSILVRWDPPEFNGGTDILKYIFNISCEDSGVTTPYHSAAPFYSLENLVVGWTYRVKVSAVNAVGEGLPTEWSDPFTIFIAGLPSVPRNAGVTEGLVTWIPPESDGGARLLVYEVRIYTTSKRTYVYNISAGGPLTYQVMESGIPVEEVYVVLIAARNRVGRGPYAIVTPIKTLTVSAIPSGDRTIRVSWISPSTIAGFLGITGFRLRYLFTGGGESEQVLDCSAGVETVDISGLTIVNYWKGLTASGGTPVNGDAGRNYSYSFQVETLLDPSVYTVGVEGAFKGMAECAPVTAPGPVANFRIIRGEDTCCKEIELAWETPKFTFQGMEAFVNDGGSPLVAYYVDISSPFGVSRVSLPVTTTRLAFTLSDPGSNVIRVSAANAYVTGPSVESTPIILTTLPDPPFDLQARAVSASDVILTWRAPWNTGGVPVSSYDVEYFVTPNVTESVRVSTGTNLTYKSFAGWSVDNVYKIRARTVTTKGVSIWTDYITFNISEDVPVVMSVVASQVEDNIVVEWDDVVGATGYHIMVNIDGDEVGGVPVYAPIVSGQLTESVFTYPNEMLPLIDGIYKFRVMALSNVGTGPWAYSNPVSLLTEEGVVCFLGDAPVRTPTGWKRIDGLRVGDLIRTSDGRDVGIQRVSYQRVRASRQTNPYRIRRGQFGATRELLISPEHRVRISRRGEMVEARRLGLSQVTWGRDRVIEYYNLELPDWERDNLVVAGVEVESLAPLRRIRVSYAEFAELLREEYGTAITAEVISQLKARCVFYLDGTVEVPVVRPAIRF